MATRKPTIRDVAERAGVSRTTVSHALSGNGRVEEGTRQRVRRAAAELGFRPSRAAAALRMGRTWTLGLMLPNGGSPQPAGDMFSIDFYLELAAAAARVAFAHDHALTLLPDVTTEAELAKFALDGVIVNDPPIGDPRLAALDELRVPYVTVERALDRPDHVAWVGCNTREATQAALDHLAAAGAQRMALAHTDLPWAWNRDTAAAYADWCRERARRPEVIEMPLEACHGARLPEAAAEQLVGAARPDAIFTAPDCYALAITRAAADRGVVVGRDLLLACGVDSRLARDHEPHVTALDLHPEAQAAAAVELLLSIIAGDEPSGPRLIDATLRVRASSRDSEAATPAA
jgi:DNA-binding LacI/PurR family transcriptional regulator